MKEDGDHERDTILIGIKDSVKAASRHFDANVQQAARRLKIVLDTYDSPQPLITLPYDAETAAVNNLLQEFEGKYAADVQTAGLTAWVEELRNRNRAFEMLAAAYTEQQAEKPPFNPKEVRRETDRAYRDIVTVISAWMLTDGDAAYAPFVAELNATVKHYNDLIAQHLGRLDAKKEKEK
jgi:chemotaxis response regulator CheB